MRKSTLNIIKLVLGLTILSVLFLNIGLKEVIDTVSKSNLLILWLVPVIYLASIFIAGANVKILADKVKKISLLRMFRYSLFTNSISLFLPGKIGGFSMVYFLKKEGIPIGKAASILTIDKMITVVVLGSFCVIGTSVLFGMTKSMMFLALLVIMVSGGIFLLYSKFSREIIKKYILRKYSSIFTGFSNTSFRFARSHKAILGANAVISLLKFLFNSLVPYAIFLSLGYNVNIFYILLIMCVELSVSLIPITLHGLGIRESVGLALYQGIGVPSHIIAGKYAIALINKYGVAAIVCFMIGKDWKGVNYDKSATDK